MARAKFLRVWVNGWGSQRIDCQVPEDINTEFMIATWRRDGGFYNGMLFIPWHSIHSIEIVEGETK